MAEETVYRVEAFNTASQSDNKIHDDAVARRLGFTGGLVPGVDVFAYMAHVPAALWGEDWLAGGTIQARFLKPVYDGALADTHARPAEDGSLLLHLESGGAHCAQGSAAWSHDRRAELAPQTEGPCFDAREPASPESLAPGRVLRTLRETFLADEARRYLRDVREELPLFADGTIAHPGFLLRRANYALLYSVRLGPWIHTESAVFFHALLRDGDPFETRAVVTANEERGGHLMVFFDFSISSGSRAILTGTHRAIYEPRQLRTPQEGGTDGT